MFSKLLPSIMLIVPIHAAYMIAFYNNGQYKLVATSFLLGLVWAILLSNWHKMMKESEDR